LKKSTLFPVSLIVLVAGIMFACADVEMTYYPTSFFAPEITHNKSAYVFFRAFYPLYEDSYKENYLADFKATNIIEWENYFKQQIKKNDLSYILYDARLGEIDTLILSIKKADYPISDELKGNSILKAADTKSVLDFLFYTGFARRCEKYAAYNVGWWDEDRKNDNPLDDKEGMAKLADGGIKQIGNANSDFVRQRYAFQVLRLYYMSGENDKCIQFYTDRKKIIESTNNSIKYRSIGYLAGAYNRNKQYGTANYFYSLAYDGCDTMKISAYFSFHPQEEEDWQQTLNMAKNTRQKAVLWQMLGIYRDPFRAMKEVYALDPKSDLLDLLLARTINVEEEHFLHQYGPYGEGETDSLDYINTGNINKELVAFLKTTAGKENTAKPYEWNLAAGYLCWVIGDKDFQKYIDKAKQEAAKDTLVQEQIRLIELLDLVKLGKAGDKKFEEKVAPELEWLRGEEHPREFRRGDAYRWVTKILETKYAKDIVKSTCFKHELSDGEMHNDDLLNTLKAFMDKKDKSAFETYAWRELQYSKTDLIEIQAVNSIYSYKLKNAMAHFNEDAAAGKEKLTANPFMIHINDCHDCDHQDSEKTIYTKKEFVQKMIDMEDIVQKNPKDAQTYFQLANGYYNMSYFGNSRDIYDAKGYYIGSSFFEFWEYSNTSGTDSLPVYVNCSKALEYYKKAIDASKDPEFKAQCCFMAAKCEQNYFFCHKPKGYIGDFKAGDYFAMMKSTYSNTKYYQEVIKECGYFKTYVNK
jgi:hypothetical protein